MNFTQNEANVNGNDMQAFRAGVFDVMKRQVAAFSDSAKNAFSSFMKSRKEIAAGLILCAAFAVSAPQSALAQDDITRNYILNDMNDEQKVKAAIEYRNDLNRLAGVTEKDERTAADGVGGTAAARKRMDYRHATAMKKASTMDEMMQVVSITNVDSMNLEMILSRPEVRKMIAQQRMPEKGATARADKM